MKANADIVEGGGWSHGQPRPQTMVTWPPTGLDFPATVIWPVTRSPVKEQIY